MQSAPLSRHWPTLILGTTALVAIALTASAALGQENTSTTILVTASVEAACSLQTDQIAIDFGVYNDADIDRDASFTYSCPAGKNIIFTLTGGAGLGSGGVRTLPNITDPGSALSYQIFNPDGEIWVNGYNISPTPGGDNALVEFSATLPGGNLASVSPGQFSDELTLTLVVNP